MIELSRNQEASGGGVIKAIGVGGAGSRAVDRLCREGIAGVELLVANADVRSLAASLTPQKVALGRNSTRGLGAGGDPEVGRAAAVESSAELAGKLAGASLIIVVAGLGGGVGSGSAPEIASIARSQGALVVAVATLPFQFEGKRRKDQALEALNGLRQSTDLVVCFDNQRMSSIVGPAAGIEDAFEVVDALLAQVIRSLSVLVRRRNILNSGLDEVAATVAGQGSTALFGFGVADGEARAEGALARAMQSALLDKGHRLAEADRLWVHVAGGEDMRWSEVQTIMTRASAQVSDQVRIFCGAAIDPALAGAVSVTILAGVPDKDSFAAEEETYAEKRIIPETAPPSYEGFAVAPAEANVVSVSQQNLVNPTQSESEYAFEPASQLGQEQKSEIYPEPVPTEMVAPSMESTSSWETLTEQTVENFEVQVHPEGEPALVRDVSTDQVEADRVMEENLVPGEIAPNHRRSSHAESSREPVHGNRSSPPIPSASGAVGTTENVRREVRQQPLPPETIRESALAASTPQPRQQVTNLPSFPDVGGDAAAKKKETVQEQMKFEPVNRGRFEKTDPTIVDGEDLDVPTFLRRRREG
jgi:cell division protein FtsZ